MLVEKRDNHRPDDSGNPFRQRAVTVTFDDLTLRFDGPGVRAVWLKGSFARGDAGPFSDVDIERLLGNDADVEPASSSYLIDERLVTTSDVRAAEVGHWFVEPQVAVNAVLGLRAAQSLIDRDGAFAQIQARANAFVWDAAMQQRADTRACQEMVGLSEEAHKGLAGLQSDSVGRLLQAQFGLSWGLLRVVQVGRGVMVATENDLPGAVMDAVGSKSEWARLCRAAFGLEPRASTLTDSVRAGLRLYVETARLLGNTIQAQDAPLVEWTVSRILAELAQATR